MGNFVENFCCVNNDDIINNRNYNNSYFDNKTNEEKNSYHNNNKEKLPSMNISLDINKLNSSTSSFLIKSTSQLPISSKMVIVGKEGDPYDYYEILNKLGEGTYGQVYKVRHKINNNIRAMKLIPTFFLQNLDENAFMEEIKISKRLNHPYIIKLYEYYVSKDYIYLINELCEEGDLGSKLIKMKKFPEFIVKIIMFQIFKALMYLSEQNIIHGDLKLENILIECYEDYSKEKKENKKYDPFVEAIKKDINLINKKIRPQYKSMTNDKREDINHINKTLKEKQEKDNNIISKYSTSFRFRAHKKEGEDKNKNQKENNNTNENNNEKKVLNIYDFSKLNFAKFGIKLIDFGCAKICTRTRKNFSDTIGTLVYCAPEVLSNNYSMACDIWSCGVLMYLLISGKFPFDGNNEEEIKGKIMSGKYEFDFELFHSISDEAKELISKCLKYEPIKRISIVEALNHRFFDDLKEARQFSQKEIQKLYDLKKMKKYSKFYQLILTYLSHNFSDNHLINELTQLYDKLDKNNDYQITKVELYKAYKEAGIPITQEELDNIVNSIDFDNNGNIEYEEFIRICIPKEKLFTDENIQNAFSLFDEEKRGFITPGQIADFIQMKKHIKDDIKQKISDEILEISEDIIDLEEFKRLMLSLANSVN